MKESLIPIMAATVLAGCGSPPSEQDVQAAFQAQMEAAVESVVGKQILGPEEMKEIKKIKVIGCAKADAGGYKCDLQTPFGAQNRRFVKSDKGWVMVLGG